MTGAAFGSTSMPMQAATTRASQYTDRPLPGQTMVVVDPTPVTVTWVAAKAVANPRSAMTSAEPATAQRWPSIAPIAAAATGSARTAITIGRTVATSASPDVAGSQPLQSGRGWPMASWSADGARVADGAPGSANTASRLPRAACARISGRKSTAVGTGMNRRRWARRQPTRSATSQPTSRTGSSDGAEAATTANRSDAPEAQAHERCASSTATNSHGSTRCAITAPRCPVVTAPTSDGAIAYSDAPMTGTQVRVVTLRTANQAPSADSGNATSMTSTTAVDGDQNTIEPSTASTAAKGSDGPVKPVPSEWKPYPTFCQSCPGVAESGRRPPPVRAGDPSSG